MKIAFVASIIRYGLCIIYVLFDYFFRKLLFTENYFRIAAMNLTTRGQLYTCLVLTKILFCDLNIFWTEYFLNLLFETIFYTQIYFTQELMFF